MSKKLTLIYILIMLECRLSIDDASKLFKIDKEVLKASITSPYICNIYMLTAIKYLLYETEIIEEYNSKGILKATYFLKRLNKILQIKDKEERTKLLKEYIDNLKGLKIKLEPKAKYTEEEKIAILKYRLKYARPNSDIYYNHGISHSTIYKMEEELPECDLKRRLKILREYLNLQYTKNLNRSLSKK